MVGSTAREMQRKVQAMICTRDAASFKFWCGCGIGRVLDFGTIDLNEIFFLQNFEIKIKIGDYVDLDNDQALVKYHYFWSCQS